MATHSYAVTLFAVMRRYIATLFSSAVGVETVPLRCHPDSGEGLRSGVCAVSPIHGTAGRITIQIPPQGGPQYTAAAVQVRVERLSTAFKFFMSVEFSCVYLQSMQTYDSGLGICNWMVDSDDSSDGAAGRSTWLTWPTRW